MSEPRHLAWWRAWRDRIHRPGLCEQTRMFRALFCLWLIAFYVPRLPYLGELITRPVLREPVLWLRLLGDPMAPIWLVQLMTVTLIVAAALCAGGVASRPCFWLVTLLHSALFMQDQANPRAYGNLALSITWLFVLAPFEPAPAGRRCDRWATNLVKLQLSSLYAFAAASKLMAEGGGWLDGRVIDRILRSPGFGQFMLSDWYTREFAGQVWAMRAIAWSTIAIEATVAVALWGRRSWRYAALLVVMLHVGIGLSMRVSPLFHLLMVAHLVLFVPDRDWLGLRRHLLAWRHQVPRWLGMGLRDSR